MKHKQILKFGLIAGSGTVAYFLLFYLINPRLMLHPAIWWASLLIYIWGMVKVLQATGAEFGENWSVLVAVRFPFGVFVLANLLFYIFYYLLFAIIDPELVNLQKELLTANENFADQLKDQDLSLTLSGTFFNYIYSLIGGFIIALVVSAIVVRQ